jgi:hypothetical protein
MRQQRTWRQCCWKRWVLYFKRQMQHRWGPWPFLPFFPSSFAFCAVVSTGAMCAHVARAPCHESEAAGAVASFLAAVLTEIYLCAACSCRNLEAKRGRRRALDRCSVRQQTRLLIRVLTGWDKVMRSSQAQLRIEARAFRALRECDDGPPPRGIPNLLPPPPPPQRTRPLRSVR